MSNDQSSSAYQKELEKLFWRNDGKVTAIEITFMCVLKILSPELKEPLRQTLQAIYEERGQWSKTFFVSDEQAALALERRAGYRECLAEFIKQLEH